MKTNWFKIINYVVLSGSVMFAALPWIDSRLRDVLVIVSMLSLGVKMLFANPNSDPPINPQLKDFQIQEKNDA